MIAAPATTWTRIARRLGRDGNPLRRRSDIIEAWLAPSALALFVLLCPLVIWLSAAAVHGSDAAVRQAQHTWRAVPAVLVQSAPGPLFADSGASTWTTRAPARWSAGGRQHSGQIPVAAGSPAGSRQTVWLSRAGQVMTPPMTPAELSAATDTAVLVAVTALAMLLAIAAGLARWLLERRRLASWDAAWLATGPRWSHQR